MDSNKKALRVLFIGNSHTFVNDLPAILQRIAGEAGYHVEVTMIAHGGWYLHQHVQEPDVPFNIHYGHYDFVVLQEHAHPFDCIEEYREAAATLVQWCKEAGSVPVIYGSWAQKAEEFEQARMNEEHENLAERLGAVLAPVGEGWWEHMRAHPEQDMYLEDGAHASPAGSTFAAQVIWDTIRKI